MSLLPCNVRKWTYVNKTDPSTKAPMESPWQEYAVADVVHVCDLPVRDVVDKLTSSDISAVWD